MSKITDIPGVTNLARTSAGVKQSEADSLPVIEVTARPIPWYAWAALGGVLVYLLVKVK